LSVKDRNSTSEARRHLARFITVGFIGIFVQIAMLDLYASVLGLHYLVATVAAVETTLVHNFIWHRSWTWADRCAGGFREGVGLLARYNLTTGVVSAIGNVILMRVFVGGLRVHVVVANLITIGICAAANYILSDRVVFSRRSSSPDAHHNRSARTLAWPNVQL